VLPHGSSPEGALALRGRKVNYTCDLGYRFTTGQQVHTITCDGQQWTPKLPLCEVVKCPTIEDIPLATWKIIYNLSDSTTDNLHPFSQDVVSLEDNTGPTFVYSSILEVTCNQGYGLLEESTVHVPSVSTLVHCMDTGLWSSNVTCQEIKCDDLTLSLRIAELIRTEEVQEDRRVLTFSCPPGFYFYTETFTKTLTCDLVGRWQPSPVKDCKSAKCRPLLTQQLNTSDNTIGTIVNVSCEDDQRFDVDEQEKHIVSVCDQFGRWVPHIPECIDRSAFKSVYLPVTEADHAESVSLVPIAFLSVAVLIIVWSDMAKYMLPARSSLRVKKSLSVSIRVNSPVMGESLNSSNSVAET